MNAENLSKVGSRLVKRCGTRDPFSIARQLGIEVLFCEMCIRDSKLDLVMDGAKHLFLNLFCADAVRAAGPAMFVRRADIGIAQTINTEISNCGIESRILVFLHFRQPQNIKEMLPPFFLIRHK